MSRIQSLPPARGRVAQLLRAIWRSEAGNALYTTMLLIPVGLGIMGAGVDGLYWFQAKQALHKAAFSAAKAAYSAHEADEDLEDAAKSALSGGADRYGDIQSLSVSIATDAGRRAADIAVSTRLILPITSKLLGFSMTIETRAASDEETTASKMAGVEASPDQTDSAESEATYSNAGATNSSPSPDQATTGVSAPATRPIITESIDRIDPSSVAKSTGPSPVFAP